MIDVADGLPIEIISGNQKLPFKGKKKIYLK